MGDFWRTRGMSFGWLRFLVCVFSMPTSFQYSDKGIDGNYWAKLNYSVTLNLNLSYSVKPYPNNCACHDRDGKIYNLAPLQNTDGRPSLTAKSNGYSYSYNPCSSFTLGPNDDGCKRDVAICWYVPGIPDSYKTIGNQGRVQCKLNKQSKIPFFVYHSNGDLQYRQVNVTLKCDESKKEKHEAIFEIVPGDDWIFQLTHLCACGDGCPTNSMKPTTKFDATTTSAPCDPMRVVILVVASAGTVGFLLVPFLVWRLLRRQNNNNDENERRRLLDNGAVDQFHNPIEEGPAGRSDPVPVASSRRKADVNVGSAQV